MGVMWDPSGTVPGAVTAWEDVLTAIAAAGVGVPVQVFPGQTYEVPTGTHACLNSWFVCEGYRKQGYEVAVTLAPGAVMQDLRGADGAVLLQDTVDGGASIVFTTNEEVAQYFRLTRGAAFISQSDPLIMLTDATLQLYMSQAYLGSLADLPVIHVIQTNLPVNEGLEIYAEDGSVLYTNCISGADTAVVQLKQDGTVLLPLLTNLGGGVLQLLPWGGRLYAQMALGLTGAIGTTDTALFVLPAYTRVDGAQHMVHTELDAGTCTLTLGTASGTNELLLSKTWANGDSAGSVFGTLPTSDLGSLFSPELGYRGVVTSPTTVWLRKTIATSVIATGMAYLTVEGVTL